jgi:two-component system, OmpR family, response regulator
VSTSPLEVFADEFVVDDPDPDHVRLVPWPSAEALRQSLAEEGQARLLLVSPDAPPPVVVDELEDWVREPCEVVEVLVRRQTLRHRAYARRRSPWLDGDILRVGEGWVALPARRVPLAALLVARLGEVVRTEELACTYEAAGGSADPAAVKAVVRRLAVNVAEVGLRLHCLRARGFLLEVAVEG